MTDEQPVWSLAALDQRQAALYAALAQYQHAAAGEAVVHPGAFGLAVYHQVERHDGATFLRAVLAHKDGGSLDSGPAAINNTAGDVFPLAEFLSRLVLGSPLLTPSAPQQTQQPAPVAPPLPLQQQEPACPMPEPAPAHEPEPACPMPQPPAAPAVEPQAQAEDAAPDPEEVEAALAALDELHQSKPEAVAEILKSYKATHPIRVAFVRSLTSLARLQTLQQLIASHS
jgi:outer membrane biosynthesis protein TonB